MTEVFADAGHSIEKRVSRILSLDADASVVVSAAADQIQEEASPVTKIC